MDWETGYLTSPRLANRDRKIKTPESTRVFQLWFILVRACSTGVAYWHPTRPFSPDATLNVAVGAALCGLIIWIAVGLVS